MSGVALSPIDGTNVYNYQNNNLSCPPNPGEDFGSTGDLSSHSTLTSTSVFRLPERPCPTTVQPVF
jgi:hypothetical protein